ncbi:MAG TPA: hypothetical protein VFT13_09060 [Candidatus Krumholzibacteria bacterium]|nr:hypothetical protein [Candidatus Krumholzibacteria bacterium]
MKPKFLLATLVMVTMTTPAFAQHGHAHGNDAAKKPVAMTGEVIDLTCFMQHPADAVGMDHAKCAKMCISQGLPIGFLAEDGTIYLLIGEGHDPIATKVADIAGKTVTINGVVTDHHGVKAIQLVSVKP